MEQVCGASVEQGPMGNKDGFLDTWTQEEEETVVSLHDTLGSR